MIKERITNYLKNRFDITYIEQDPPGILFEYPAIKYALQMACDLNKPVLYIHTKGAADPLKNGIKNRLNNYGNKNLVLKKLLKLIIE